MGFLESRLIGFYDYAENSIDRGFMGFKGYAEGAYIQILLKNYGINTGAT